MSHQQKENKELGKRHISEMEQNYSEQESIIFPQNSHIKADLCQQNIYVPERRKEYSYHIHQIAIKLLKCTVGLPWLRNSWKSCV